MPKRSTSQAAVLGWLLLGSGLTAVVVGLAWNQILPDSTFWSEEQAAEYTQAYEAAHAATSSKDHSHKPGEPHHHDAPSEELTLARERFESAHRDLVQAQQARNDWGVWIACGGVLLACLGLVLTRRAAEQTHRQPKP